MKKISPFIRNRSLLAVMVLLLLSASGFGIYNWQANQLQTGTAVPQPTYETVTVQRGNLSATISGTGQVVTSNTADLLFPVAGTVGQVNVNVGDTVTSGEVLASLSNINELKLTVANDQLALQVAQQNLTTLLSSGDANLAQAYSDMLNAQNAMSVAQYNVHSKRDPTCSDSLTHQYWFEYMQYKQEADPWENALSSGKTGYSTNYILQNLNPLRAKRDTAYMNWEYCQGYSDQQVLESQVNFQLAQAKSQQASAQYAYLKANQGVDPIQVQIDEAAVQNAQLQLAKSQQDLTGASLVAPMDGTVLAVNGSAGQPADTTAFITLANLNHPFIQVNIDETDLSNFQAGCPADVTFDSLPGQTFKGSVVQVFPSLANVQNVATAQGLVQLQGDLKGKTFPVNLSANVDVNCSLAQNVLMIPSPAVRQDANGSPFVYILNASGKPEKRSIEIGQSTLEYTEIKSGLNAGDRVITSNFQLP